MKAIELILSKPHFLLSVAGFIQIGFLEISWFDILDIILVGLLIYQLYRLLKGSLAFSIFIGLVLIYLIYYLVRLLNMELLSGILGQFIGVGVIALIIVFQPEIRRFLLLVGRTSQLRRSRIWNQLVGTDLPSREEREKLVQQIVGALVNFTMTNTGAILVFSDTSKLQFFANTGVKVDAEISGKLLESIFEKNSPLHDGAVIIADDKLYAAGCVLPVSENPYLPARIGMRHKAGVGITEHSDAIAIIVSEETGEISYAKNGQLEHHVSIQVRSEDKLLHYCLTG
ncbi:MAG: TIGR00159 family protein [Bacteroidetes bacterium SW_11_45_7]|nr:MAG: TIGR00159 family protein [Bacteroidetes bacterium SW_11_45_7]